MQRGILKIPFLFKEQNMHTAIFDVTNLMYISAAAVSKNIKYDKGATVEDIPKMVLHSVLLMMLKWKSKIKADNVIAAFEGGNNWRKTYTEENGNIRKYKANRVYDPMLAELRNALPLFKELLDEHTALTVFSVSKMEADDVIAAFCQLEANENHQVTIISSDQDYIQLLKNENVKLLNPISGQYRNTPSDKKYVENIDYWLFLKLIRGDSGDNVQSAFPKVRETKLKEAFNDSFKMINLLNETWKDGNGNVNIVKDKIEENRILMDLACQPIDIRNELETGVRQQWNKIRKYNHIKFLNGLGKLGLNSIALDIEKLKSILIVPSNKPTTTNQTIQF